MNKISRIIAGLTISLILSLQFASASTFSTNLKADQILPESIDVLYEFNTEQENPFESFIIDAFSSGFMSAAEDTEESTEALETLTNLLETNIFTLAIDLDDITITEGEDPNMYISLYVSEEDFNSLIELAPDQEEYESATIYKGDEDIFILYLNNEILFITNTNELAKELVDNSISSEARTLSEFSTYQNAQSHFLENGFLNLYINPKFILDTESGDIDEFFVKESMMMVDVDSELVQAILGEGVSLSKAEDGYGFSIYIEGDEDKLEELDLLLDKYNFTPALYKYISGRDLILYTEQGEFEKNINDSLKTLSDDSEFQSFFTEFKDWLNEESELDFDKDILPVLDGQYMFTMHKTNQIYPAMTLMVDVSKNRSEATSLLSEIANTVKNKWETMEEADGKNYYNYDIVRAGGKSFYEHTFNIAELSEDSELLALPIEQTELKLSMAVSESTLVISTHTELDRVYMAEDGLLDNEAFAELFTDRSEQASSIMYLNFEGLFDYANVLMTAMEAPEDVITSVNTFAAPWKDLYAKTYADKSTSWGEGILRVDHEGIENYAETLPLEDLFPMFNDFEDYDDYGYEPLELLPMMQTTYCDVSTSDWFYDDVMSLSSSAIVSGYEDGCFRPNNEITRAEFTKMAVEGASYGGFFPWSAMSDQDEYFTDTDADAWYTYYINQAAAIGYVEGYADGTFRPNAPITRAEAVQILYNMNSTLQTFSNTNPFDDVHAADWFYEAVGAAYNGEMVSGKSINTFAPHMNITRAESAKIVNLLINNDWDYEGCTDC